MVTVGAKNWTCNLLWHHCPRRLQGEAIRDSLTFSGRLDTTTFGPPVPIHLTSFMDEAVQNGSLDGDGRRSIYISVRRTLRPSCWHSTRQLRSVPWAGGMSLTFQPTHSLNDPLVVELADD